MRASETSLRNLLEGGKQFQIPLFQRQYAWEEKNWSTLWEDIMTLYDDKVEGSYFLGPIVTQAISSTADGISRFIVIDGQQRLITLTILLATLRACLLKIEKKALADELYELYLINKFKENDDFYKVLPTQGDREVYSLIVSEEENKSADEKTIQNKIYGAKKFFDTKINKLERADLSNFLNGIKTIVLERLSLVNITSEKDDNPYLIFESLNHKGQALTQADLLRNYIFMKLPDKQRENIYQQKWLPCQNEFKLNSKNNDVSEITQAFWFYSRKDGNTVTKKEVYKAIKASFDDAESIELELEKLIRFAKYYQCLNFKEREKTLENCFKRLRRLKYDTCNIFLLNVYDDYQNSKISLAEFEEISRYIESYLVRRFFLNISTQTLGSLFSKLYAEVKNHDSNNFIESLRNVLTSYKDSKRFPEDKEFHESIVRKDIYNTSKTDKVKFILERIENYLCLEDVDINKKVSIEHIMPQDLEEEWKKSLGDKYETIHQAYVHKIGNLTLTGCNSKLSNKAFKEKKTIYQKSNLSLNKYFKDHNIISWNEADIISRAEHLADLAVKIWSR